MTRRKFKPGSVDTISWGGRSVIEEIQQHTDNCDCPGVYCLRLLQPRSKSTLVERWQHFHGRDPPSWAWAAYHSTTVYYVGGTGNVRLRITGHSHPDEAADITAAFPIWRVEDVVPCPNRDSALEYEPEYAGELQDELAGDPFVFQA